MANRRQCIRFPVPYGRPIRLSDPYRDFPDGWLRDLLKTPDAEMDWNQFREIFQAGIPAGHELREHYNYWPGRIQGENVTRAPYPMLDKLILDLDLLEGHFNRIRGTIVANEPSPTYWRTRRDWIGIDASDSAAGSRG